ncbi:2OG-Fe(II) oxygenase [Methylovulum psychrotolerans]|uniref:Prolyl 4-hydroxylase alpha subunit Fe(2+) 2OG dioxygenase domain-containing protein n=1 Tax=Methylovulum psychrotolerans TaxID=1704499 RepID=A0A2S5CHA6_9GAMM|nr:2OG-Fe(II) oxygenase [Methylovulum psychrotolerans]POZ50203.1 hypothetical protein AADEFJLK_03952 [Methylovulum psychrotolerans]
MPPITEQLFQLLQGVDCPGNYYTTGIIETFPPLIEVEGVGRVALPLLPAQVEPLVAAAERAPYGRGQETLVDTQVRRTWQIDAVRISLGGKHWQATLNSIVSRAAQGLGVDDGVVAELYKLLVYDTGSFFISHRDTEKAPGMFATLVIVLPSAYSGGELVVRHQQEEVKLDLRCTDPSEMAFAAFYADCQHEILPITEGCRLTLIYNLVRTNKKLPLPTPPDYRQEQHKVAVLLRQWAEQLADEQPKPYDDDDTYTEAPLPDKLLYLLEHAYTPAELSFAALKNGDAAIAEVLVAAAGQADCDIYLALASIEESGTAEYGGYDRYRRDYDLEPGEVEDSTETLGHWRRLDGSEPPLPQMPFAEYECCPPDAFADIEPDEVQFEEATGNAGASFERTYHCGALVIWPHSRYLAVVNQVGLCGAVPILQEFCQTLPAAGRLDTNTIIWQDAHRLAGYILRDWIPGTLGEHSRYNDANLTAFLECLYCLQDSGHSRQFWLEFASLGVYHRAYCASLVQIARLLPWPDVVDGLTRAISTSAEHHALEACAALLLNFSQAYPDQAGDLSPAANILLQALPGDIARFAHLPPWQYARITVNESLVADLLTGFSAIETVLAEKLLDYLLAWPELYKMDGLLIPAALNLTATAATAGLPAIVRLRDEVIAYLQARVAEDLTPPADWRRPSQLNCVCADCIGLSLFLDDPSEAKWRFKAAENRRQHIADTVKSNHCDVNLQTGKDGRPYTLICTKNQASYQRRVTQRQQDLETLQTLSVPL